MSLRFKRLTAEERSELEEMKVSRFEREKDGAFAFCQGMLGLDNFLPTGFSVLNH